MIWSVFGVACVETNGSIEYGDQSSAQEKHRAYSPGITLNADRPESNQLSRTTRQSRNHVLLTQWPERTCYLQKAL